MDRRLADKRVFKRSSVYLTNLLSDLDDFAADRENVIALDFAKIESGVLL